MINYLVEKSLNGNKWYEYYLYPFISLTIAYIYAVLAFNIFAITVYILGLWKSDRIVWLLNL